VLFRSGSGKDKASNGYDLTIGAVGPQGIAGTDGATGAVGADGDDGAAGATGAVGADGTSCSITACIEPGEYTFTCGDTTVALPCICYAIGDTGPAGGIVFYITEECTHGLEAAPEDQDSGEWGCFGTSIDGADDTAIGTGAQNTADILAGCADPDKAADIANVYSLNGFNDWFLPSKDELNELYLQKGVVGDFANDRYWSSSEFSSFFAWYQNFDDGGQVGDGKFVTRRVRAVRAF
jgi:hypothetical protein